MKEQIVVLVNFFMFIWFNTDAFIHYFRPISLFKINEFKEYLRFNKRMTYPNWIYLNNPNFLTKIISCKPCLCFFFNLFFSFFAWSNSLVLIETYLFSYITYRILDKYVY